MLPAQNRLRQRQDFARVYAKGDRYSGKYLRLRVYRIAHTANSLEIASQVGFVIAKKVSKKATARNRIKRQLRAIFRTFLSQLKQGLQIVVTVSNLQGDPDYKQLWEDLTKLLIAAKVLHGS